MIDKEDLEAIKKRKIKLVFILGGPGAGKGTYCNKLVSDFKYNHISTGDCIRDEIKRKTNLGMQCEPFSSKGQLVPFDMITRILVKAILSKSGSNFLIDGFPRSLEQALYLDKHVKDMKIILNVFADDEILRKRLMNRANLLGRKDDSDEKIINERIKIFKEESLPAINFYQKYGIVKDINSNFDVNTCYATVVENLLPEVYCVIGKRYSGKSSVCKFLEKRINGKVIDFNEFLKDKNIIKLKENNEFVISSFLQKLRDNDENRVIIEDFPLKQEYLNLFVRNGKAIRKLFYLNCDDNNCTIRMKELGKENKNYVGCASLRNENTGFDNKRELLELFRKKTNFIELNSNNPLNIVYEEVVKAIKPEIYIFDSDNDSKKLKNDLITYFESKLKFELVDVPSIVDQTIMRGNKLGQTIEELRKRGKHIPNELIIEMLRPVLLKEQKNKYILLNYPSNTNDVIEFEREICSIDKLVYVSSKYPLPLNANYTEDSLEVLFKKSNRFYYYDKKEISEFYTNEIFNKNREFSIVYGLPYSGKKVISNYLSAKYGFKILDFTAITDALKKRMAGEEGNPDEQVVDFTKFINELKEIINKIPFSQRFLITNIGIHIKEADQISKIIEVCGVPKTLFNLVVNNVPLMERYQKAKNDGSTEPLNEEQKEDFNRGQENPKKIRDKLKSLAIRVLPINNSMAESTAHKFINKYLGRNFIIIKHDYDIGINHVLNLLSTIHKILVVNIPSLIYTEFIKNSSIWSKLNATFSKKRLKLKIVITEEEKIYYDYNPIHFCQKLIRELIDNYINEQIKQIENSANIIILVGYLNNDLLEKDLTSFNLPLYEINSLNILGNILSFIQITRSTVETIEKEEAKELEKPKPIVKEEKKDDLDKIDDENNKDKKEEVKVEEEKKEEPGEDGTLPYHPEKYKWTFTDGIARNYTQHLIKYTKYPLITKNVSENTLLDSLFKVISETIIINVNIYNEFVSFLQSEVEDKNNKKTGINEGKICLFLLK